MGRGGRVWGCRPLLLDLSAVLARSCFFLPAATGDGSGFARRRIAARPAKRLPSANGPGSRRTRTTSAERRMWNECGNGAPKIPDPLAAKRGRCGYKISLHLKRLRRSRLQQCEVTFQAISPRRSPKISLPTARQGRRYKISPSFKILSSWGLSQRWRGCRYKRA